MQTARRPQGSQPKFSPRNDAKLVRLVNQHGTNKWKHIARCFKNKTAKQCRNRWMNYLSPSITRGTWTEEEDALILRNFEQYGPKWVKMQEDMPKRTANDIRMRYLKLHRRIEKELRKNREETPIIELKEERHEIPPPIQIVDEGHDIFEQIFTKYESEIINFIFHDINDCA